MDIKVKNIVNIIGRGQLVVCELPDDLLKDGNDDFLKIPDISIGATLTIDNNEYVIKGYEKWSASNIVAFKLDKEIAEEKIISIDHAKY